MPPLWQELGAVVTLLDLARVYVSECVGQSAIDALDFIAWAEGAIATVSTHQEVQAALEEAALEPLECDDCGGHGRAAYEDWDLVCERCRGTGWVRSGGGEFEALPVVWRSLRVVTGEVTV